MFVDSDHAENRIIMKYGTGFSTYIDMSTISLYFKQYYAIETSVFCTEFVSKAVANTLHTIQYKLRKMGIYIS